MSVSGYKNDKHEDIHLDSKIEVYTAGKTEQLKRRPHSVHIHVLEALMHMVQL